MINLILAIHRAWQAGQIIRDPARWKSGGELTASITIFVAAIFTIVLFFFPSFSAYLTTEMAVFCGTLVITILSMIQIVIGRITTRREMGLTVLMEDEEDLPNPRRRSDDIKLLMAEVWLEPSRKKEPEKSILQNKDTT